MGRHGERTRILKKFVDDDYCFACGESNPSGLHLDIDCKSPGECVIQWLPLPEYQGYSGVLHGGIASTILDEAMAYASISLAGPAATVEITVRYRSPVATGSPVTVKARARRLRGRVLSAEAELVQDGETRCTAAARFICAS